MPEYNTLDELDAGQRVLVRLDLNSPVADGVVQDNNRFDRYSETVRALADDDHRVVVMAHQGRPGKAGFLSLEQHAEILAEHIGQPVQFVSDTHGASAIEAIERLDPGAVLMLENTRMTADELPEKPPEEHADSEFVQTLAANVDAYVNDAYSVAHRSHASTVGFPSHLPSYAGLVMDREYEYNTSVANREFNGPVTMVCGGNKSTDVIAVADSLGGNVDNFLLGGLPGELFLRAEGYPVGHDVGGMALLDEQYETVAPTLTSLVENRREQFGLPSDFAYEADGERAEIHLEEIETKTHPLLDIGQDTIDSYVSVIEESAAVFVKGAVGVFEDDRFATGTVELVEAIARTDCFSVIGGGDTARVLDLYGIDESQFDHVSIAGGAYLNALTGTELPAVEVLRKYA